MRVILPVNNGIPFLVPDGLPILIEVLFPVDVDSSFLLVLTLLLGGVAYASPEPPLLPPLFF